MAVSEANLSLLISGYIREQEKELKLYMIIPTGIARIILIFYPVLLFKFGDFNKGQFQINDDKTILTGQPNWKGTCNGHLVYADLGQFNDIGLNEGIHLWSIQNLANDHNGCFLSIGVTTAKSYKLINEWKREDNAFGLYVDSTFGSSNYEHWIDQGFNSYWKGYSFWKENQVMTIKLNCNDWSVTYYQDGIQVKNEEIEAGQCYYFALLCCDNDVYTHLKVVETQAIQ